MTSVSGGGGGLMLSSPARPSQHEPHSDHRPEEQTCDQIADFRHAREGEGRCHQAARACGLVSFGLLAAARQLGGKPGEKGERGHAQCHVPVPAMPGAGFAVVEPQFLLGALEAFLDRPA